MRQIVVFSQWITFIFILCEMWLVFKKMRNRAHYYLFMNSIALFLYSVGSLLLLFVEKEEAYFLAFMISWVGKIGTVVFLLHFCICFFEYKLPVVVTAIESGMSAITCVVLATTKKTNLFYKNLRFVKDEGLTIVEYEDGPWHTLWNAIVVVVILTCLFMMVKSLAGEKNQKKRKQFMVVFYALLIELPIGYLTSLPIAKYYDFNQLGFLLIVILILFSMFRNAFMDTEALAKDYVIDELSSGVIAMDENETVAYYNKKALQIFPDILGDELGVIAQIEASICSGEPITIEDKIYHFEERKLEGKASEEGKLYVIIDSTKQYQHLKEVEREKQIADAANRAKTDFLARMSHEIRTPINAVLGMDEMILRECKDETIQEYARDIQTAGHTLLTIINDILDLNKIESGKMELVPVTYDLKSLVSEIANMIKLRAEAGKLSFHVSVAPEIPAKLFGDDVKLRQVLTNLLTNAVKYTPRGDVWLGIDLKEKVEDTEGQAVVLHVEVRDTGVGIRPEDMSKLFSEFGRIESEHFGKIEGTGLGMPITMKLLALMDSELMVESEYGKGSVFSFDLRQRVAEETTAEKQEEKGEDNTQKRYVQTDSFTAPEAHILLVDDNVINRRVFSALVKRTQIRITEAESGVKAIELAAAQRFDLIFMDHMMPGMDGITAMKNIRSATDGPCAGVPIIVLTANAIEGSREKYLEAGFDGYLSKPIATEELLGLIAYYLPEEKIKK